MHWLEALERYLEEYVRPYRTRPITCATVESEAGPPPTPILCELVGGWWIEERETPRGNIALHLFPSVE